MAKNYESIVLENKDNHKFIWLPTSAEADERRNQFKEEYAAQFLRKNFSKQ